MNSSLEPQILSAIIEDKQAYEEFEKVGRLDELSPLNQLIARAVRKYRGRDRDVGQVDRLLLEEQLLRDVKNDKHVDPIRRALGAIPSGVSCANIREHVRALHRQAAGGRLSLALANGAPENEVSRLIQEYAKADDAGEVTDEASSIVLVDVLDTADLTEERTQADEYIKLAPKALNDRLDGGALRGHHVLVFARPETGKTLFVVNACAGFLHQRLNVLYVGNEEPAADVRDRIRGRILKVGKVHVRTNREETAARLSKADLGYLAILETATFSEVRKTLENVGNFDVVVFDQIRNMRLKSDSRTAELEAAGIEARAIAKEYKCLVLSVTQAGDSATGKVYLDMSDVDSSKTGLPASADLLLGLGADEGMKVNNLLGVSLAKNKMSGSHDKFLVTIDYVKGTVE